MNQEFLGKVALVTGAAGAGIGQATARRLAAAGATVVITDSHESRNKAVTSSVAKDFPDTVIVGHVLDCGNQGNIARVMETVASEVGAVTLLVNNAARNVLGTIWDYDPLEWERTVAINLTGPWLLSKLAMTQMREVGGGVIVNVSTYSPDVGGLGIEAPYAVTKGGLNVLTRSCAQEGGAYNIRCNAVSMGLVQGTRFVERHPELLNRPDTQTPLGHLPSAVDIAEAIAFLASDRASGITGEILNVSAGAYMRN